jgi:hypothetical protein
VIPNVGCLGFCELVQQVQSDAKLTTPFATNLRDSKVTIPGITFTISTEAIVEATDIPNSGEKWFKNLDPDTQHYRPFFKGDYKEGIKKVFPFGQLLEKYAPLMKIIMKYFSCEGRFPRLYKISCEVVDAFYKNKAPQLTFLPLQKSVKDGRKSIAHAM